MLRDVCRGSNLLTYACVSQVSLQQTGAAPIFQILSCQDTTRLTWLNVQPVVVRLENTTSGCSWPSSIAAAHC